MHSSTVPTSISLLRVADYARLSDDDAKDPELRGENVAIQLDECELARSQRPDWQHVGSFKDNDVSASAYGGEVRKDFECLMALVRASGVDVLQCVEVTRLFRKPLEAEVLIDLVWGKHTSFHTIVTTRGGYYDLRTSAGRKAVRDAVNAAAGESDVISDRVRVKKAALARRGLPNGGRRPYGFELDQITQRESEVAVLRQIAGRVIKGTSVRAVIGELNDQGVPTAEGSKWRQTNLLDTLRRKRYAPYDDSGKAIRVHKGVEYKAVWDAVFDATTWQRLQTALQLNTELKVQRGNSRKHLLTGFVYCGECGGRLSGCARRDRPGAPARPRYFCKCFDNFGQRKGCGKVSRLAEPLEDFVTRAVLFRLDSPEFAAVLAETDTESAQLQVALAATRAQQQRLDDLIDGYYGENPDQLTREQFMRAKMAAELTLRRAEREVSQYSAKQTLIGVPIGQTVTEAWRRNPDLGWRRQVTGLTVDKVIVHRGGGRPRYECLFSSEVFLFDPDAIEIVWKT